MKLFHHNVETKANKGLKALVISDIHYFSNKDDFKLKEIIDELKNNHYDVIYLVGDIIDSTNMFMDKDAYQTLLKFIKMLGNYAPTYIAYGSHDLAAFDYSTKNIEWFPDKFTFIDKFIDVVKKYPNIYIVSNKIYELPNNDTVSIINPSLEYAMETPDGNEKELLNGANLKYSFLKNIDYKKTNTLLCHYPQAIFSLHKASLLKGIDLAIAGHNHNGITQLRIFPFESMLNLIHQNNRGLITPAMSIANKDTKYLRGNIKLDDKSLLVINPAITSLGETTGMLHSFDKIFYRGASVINYIPEEKMHEKKGR